MAVIVPSRRTPVLMSMRAAWRALAAISSSV
jgi:hypothetical protein